MAIRSGQPDQPRSEQGQPDIRRGAQIQSDLDAGERSAQSGPWAAVPTWK
jgi:hypothetical protein